MLRPLDRTRYMACINRLLVRAAVDGRAFCHSRLQKCHSQRPMCVSACAVYWRWMANGDARGGAGGAQRGGRGPGTTAARGRERETDRERWREKDREALNASRLPALPSASKTRSLNPSGNGGSVNWPSTDSHVWPAVAIDKHGEQAARVPTLSRKFFFLPLPFPFTNGGLG